MDRAHTFSRPIGLFSGGGDQRKSSSVGEQSSEESLSEGGGSPEDWLHLMNLPDSLLLEVFMFLPLQSIVSISRSCSRFSRIARDEQLWKIIFRRDFKVPSSVPLHPRAVSWRAEYRRLLDESPAVLCEEVLKHKDQALHISFSHNGKMFATSSKDGTIKVWNATTPCTLRFAADMKARFRWRYTQYCQFNKSDTLLLISGVHEGDNTTTGEIAVFDLTQDFRFMSRVLNKPYDVFGAWYDDSHLLLGTLHWIGQLESISAVWLAKASREVESERKYAMMNPFRFNNFNASSIRTIMVADVPVKTEQSCSASDRETGICSDCGLDIHPGEMMETFADTSDGNSNSNNEVFSWSIASAGSEESMACEDSSVAAESQYVEKTGAGSKSKDKTKAPSQCEERTRVGKGKTVLKHSTEAGMSEGMEREGSSGGLNHSPAKNARHLDFDFEACSVNSHSSPSVGPNWLWCCCRGNSSVSSPTLKSCDSNNLVYASSSQAGERSTQSNLPQASSSKLNAADMQSTVQGAALSRQNSYPSSPKYQHASDIPRMTSLTRRKGKIIRTEKLLIFTLGEETYSPHLVGIKRMKEEDIRKEEDAMEGYDWPETEEGLLPLSDRDIGGTGRSTALDCTINMHGHIVGMALSPDERYLYVNSRQWPNNYRIEKVMEPPPIAQEIDIHVIDLVTLKEVGTIMRSHKAFTPNDECFFLFLDVSDLYVASGAEDKRGYMWDRHYGVHLRCFPHSDVVNSCAFNPSDPEMLVTVSDDNKIKIWRSRRQMREMRSREGIQ